MEEAAKPKTTKRVPKSGKTGVAVKKSPKPPAAGGAATKEETKSRIRIKVRAYDSKIIDQAVQSIIQVAERNSAQVVGPVPLPTEKRKYTVNRSTFVHKDAREQFEMRVHKRLIDIIEPNSKVIEAMSSLNLPSGVDIEIKM